MKRKKPAVKTPTKKAKKQSKTASFPLRPKSRLLQIDNSGLEVWLYDESNLKKIRGKHGLDFLKGDGDARFEKLTQAGTLVAYSLMQDDGLNIVVICGKAPTKKELSTGRWLEPQHALLCLPSGVLCVEFNDASRLQPGEPGCKGEQVTVPPGDYKLTLYRSDDEALRREGIEWEGPQEIIHLAPGGTKADAADGFLSFEERRDTGWVGDYKIEGDRFRGLAWCSDYWDTCIVNIDWAAAKKLKLSPGSYIQVSVPAIDISLILAYDESWQKAVKHPAPGGVSLDEYGYAAFCEMAEWPGTEPLYCRRRKAKKCIEDQHQTLWLPAEVKVLDAAKYIRVPDSRRTPLLESKKRRYFTADICQRVSYDPNFLGLVLSDVLQWPDDADELSLEEALQRANKMLEKNGLKAHTDVGCENIHAVDADECTYRIYTSDKDLFAALRAADGSFQLMFLSQTNGGTWIVTGFIDELDHILERSEAELPVVHQNCDEPIAEMLNQHWAAIKEQGGKLRKGPESFEQALNAFEEFCATAFD